MNRVEMREEKGTRMKAESYDDATSFLSTFNQLHGLRVLEYPRGRLRPVLSCLYVSVLLMSLIGTVHVYNFFKHKLTLPSFEIVIYQLTSYIHTFSIIGSAIVGLYNSKRYVRYKMYVADITKKLSVLGCTINHRKLRIRTNGAILATTLYMLVTGGIYLEWLWTKTNPVNAMHILLSYMYASGFTSAIIIEFGTSVGWITLRFRQLNELLAESCTIEERQLEQAARESMVLALPRADFPARLDAWKKSYREFSEPSVSLDNSRPEAKEARLKPKKHVLRQIRLVHLKLSSASKMVSELFSVQMAIEIRLAVIYITVSLYSMYAEYSKSWGTNIRDNVATMSIIEAFNLALKVAVVAYSCEMTCREAMKTPEILHLCSKPGDDLETKQELQQFALQLSQTRHAVLGSFVMNYTFVRQCISSITTYLIIMIQMSNAIENHWVSYKNTTNSTGY